VHSTALGDKPGNLEARLGMARGAAKAGDRAAAAQEYLRILQIVPEQPEARRELARLGRAAGPSLDAERHPQHGSSTRSGMIVPDS
jgi:predicted TPR repeat methyltransferase